MKIPLLLALLPVLAQAAEPSDQTRSAAYQSGVAQDQLRIASQRLKDDLLRLVDDFSKYPSASGDVATLKNTVAELDKVSSGDMAAVARILLEASRNMDDAALARTLRDALSDQQGIQVALRTMADQLAQQSNLVSMDQRLNDLALRQLANLKATRDLAAKAPTPGELQGDDAGTLNRRKDDQATLDSEIRLAIDVLGKMTATTEAKSPSAAALKTAADLASRYRLESLSKEAAWQTDRDFKLALENQEKVLHVLKTMIAALDESKTKAERAAELAGKLRELAERQAELAKKTETLNERDQDEASTEQQQIANELDLLQDELSQQDKEAEAKEAARISEIAADELADENFTDNQPRKDRTKQAQDQVAGNLEEMADTMQEKADELAGNSREPAEKSETQAALEDAMDTLAEARDDINEARRQNDAQQDSSAASKSAEEKLAQAMDEAAKAEDAAGQGAKEALQAAKDHAGKAADKQEIGHNLYHAAAKLEEALGQLQEAASELAVKSSDSDAQSSEMADGDGDGGLGHSQSANTTRHDARGIASDARRAALDLQQQDKVAAAYEPSVAQYLKNLAGERAANP